VLLDRTNNARIEIDVLIADTLADPAKTFLAYFDKMKNQAEAFRKFVGCSTRCAQKATDRVAD
jgi:hypothetical protein